MWLCKGQKDFSHQSGNQQGCGFGLGPSLIIYGKHVTISQCVTRSNMIASCCHFLLPYFSETVTPPVEGPFRHLPAFSTTPRSFPVENRFLSSTDVSCSSIVALQDYLYYLYFHRVFLTFTKQEHFQLCLALTSRQKCPCYLTIIPYYHH